MKIKRILFAALLAAGCFNASAQTTQTVDAFNHHWYLQAQGGAQYTLGEVDFGDLLSPNVQVGVGYLFNPVLGVRLSVNGWQSKGGTDYTYSAPDYALYKWKWNYVAPMLDATLDLTNLIGGYKPRLVSVGVLGGLGANIGWHNDDAQGINAQMVANGRISQRPMRYLWDGTKVRFAGRVGAFVDFHVWKRVDLGIEINANTLSDHYNSKKAGNSDWYFNALAGVRVHLGKLTKQVTKENPCGEIVVEKIVEKPVEKIVYRDREVAKREALRKDIFFTIRNTNVSSSEMPKVEDIAAYLNKYPEAKVVITGYADKGTGNAKINERLAKKRSEIVADLLKNKFGIASSRISIDSKGDTVQPFEQNDLNRVSICIAE